MLWNQDRIIATIEHHLSRELTLTSRRKTIFLGLSFKSPQTHHKNLGKACIIDKMKIDNSLYSPYFNNWMLFHRLTQLISIVIFASHFFVPLILWQVNCATAQTAFPSQPTYSGGTDSLYRDMLSSVEGAISISADVGQQIRMFGQEYSARGTYHELKTTELRSKGAVRFRLDLTVQSSTNTPETDSSHSFTIVCDNTYNSIYRYFSLGAEKRWEVIEIKRLVEAVEKHGRSDVPIEVGSMFGLGGLAGMLREMRNRYDFSAAPVETQIQEKNSVMAVWKIRGRLKPGLVTSLTADASGKIRPIPKHTPTAIDISIGVNDRFPYRFDYFWTADGSESTGEPYANLVFYNLILHDRNISKTIFDYRPPGNILPENVTDRVIEQVLR